MRIVCTYEEYDKIETLFEQMYFKADDYVPTNKEMDTIILPNLEAYVLFLLWIDLTGIKTEENQKLRQRIHHILTQNLELVDELTDDELANNELIIKDAVSEEASR